MNVLSTRSLFAALLFALFSCLFSGCQSGDQTRGESDTDTLHAKPECYRFVQGRDTIDLSILETNGKVKGRLAFRFFEKDKSSGTLEGVMKGDTLFANYAFTSEGMLSNREVAFRKVGNDFRMGSGEILNTGNMDVLRDPSVLEFSEKVVLRSIGCDTSSQSSIR